MCLRDLYQANSILYGFSAGSRDDTIELLAETLASRGLIQNESEVKNRITHTDSVHTTAIGNGVAIPHATVDRLEKTLLMVAVSRDPVAFGPTKVETCSVFFLLLSPADHGGEHIKILARIARFASDPSAAERLRSAGSEELLVETMDDRR